MRSFIVTVLLFLALFVVLLSLPQTTEAIPPQYCHRCFCPYGCYAQSYGACNHDLLAYMAVITNCSESLNNDNDANNAAYAQSGINCGWVCDSACTSGWGSTSCCNTWNVQTCSDNLLACYSGYCTAEDNALHPGDSIKIGANDATVTNYTNPWANFSNGIQPTVVFLN